jgi:hypothetical protein
MRLCPRELEKLKLHNVSLNLDRRLSRTQDMHGLGSLDVPRADGQSKEAEEEEACICMQYLDRSMSLVDGSIHIILTPFLLPPIHPSANCMRRQAGFLAQKRLARGVRLNYPGE